MQVHLDWASGITVTITVPDRVSIDDFLSIVDGLESMIKRDGKHVPVAHIEEEVARRVAEQQRTPAQAPPIPPDVREYPVPRPSFVPPAPVAKPVTPPAVPGNPAPQPPGSAQPDIEQHMRSIERRAARISHALKHAVQQERI